MAEPDLSVILGPLRLPAPVLVASGTFGFGLEVADLVDLSGLGGICVKGLTMTARSGNTGRRLAETPAGLLNSIGLENPGVKEFLQHILPQLRRYRVPVIANISGNTEEEYAQMAAMLTVPGVAAVEVNISCPNVRHGGLAFGTDPACASAVVRAVREHTSVPVIAKLSPNVTDITVIARAVEEAGADIISLINTLSGMAIDVDTRRPVLGSVTGGLSGPAVKPVALRMVWQAYHTVRIPIIGMGGIMNWRDAVEFLLAGAAAVAVGTANLINPAAALDIASGISSYLQQRKLTSVADIVGQLQLGE